MRVFLIALAIIYAFPGVAKSDKQSLIQSSKDFLVRLECHEISKDALSSSYRVQTGVVIDKDLVLTSLNFVNDSSIVNVFKYANQERYGCGLIWKDSLHNLAIFRVPKLNSSAIKLAESKNLSQIDEIMIYNCGRRDSLYFEATWGILSGSPTDTIITVGAPVNPGGVGAPVVTMNGELAGIIVDKEVSLFVEGVAYMSNIDLVKDAISTINSSALPLGAVKEFETLDLLGKAFENEMKSYDVKDITLEISLLKESLELVDMGMSKSATNIEKAFFKAYLTKLYFNALVSDYQEDLAIEVYKDYINLAMDVKKSNYNQANLNNTLSFDDYTRIELDKFDSMSIAADKARMSQVQFILDGIKANIRESDFYGYILYGRTPSMLKKIITE